MTRAHARVTRADIMSYCPTALTSPVTSHQEFAVVFQCQDIEASAQDISDLKKFARECWRLYMPLLAKLVAKPVNRHRLKAQGCEN